MSDPVPKGVKLHKSAPKGLLIVPESEWTDYDRRIWDAFDEIAGEIFMGTPPPHCTMAMGRMNGKPVLISRTFYANLGDGMEMFDHKDDSSQFANILWSGYPRRGWRQ